MYGNVWERSIDPDTPTTPLSSSEHYTSTPASELSLSRRRSESLSSATGRRRGSFGTEFVSRRHGTIDILGVGSTRGSRRSSYSSVAATYQSTPPTTNERDPSPPHSPVVHVTNSTVRDDSRLLGRWQCCECRRGHGVHRFEQGQQLINALNCLCPHRSCSNCTFQGRIKRFAPIYDVGGSALMPIAGDGDQILHMGIVCRYCGLSWQAQKSEAPRRRKSFRQRLSMLPKKINPMPTLRHARSMIHLGLPRDPHSDDARPGTSLSTSRSFLNLRSASDAQRRESKPERQTQAIQVRFYGIECTCGSVTDERDICFVFLALPKARSNTGKREDTGCKVIHATEPPYLLELRVKGYGTPTLHLKGGSHPNPLMSNLGATHPGYEGDTDRTFASWF
ncbi:uncharacterized protein M421DRAFT_419319 [Didymella exigua CBS 183.55]|uniref:Uncharacterized protein n=1 Tax=Didymella exigua CBS 183.55 TaxID=1150837 RepID=A0A6A5RPE9_9PLEO|nr:uncharacterized protein M421DRAFT_419319 [Didymella exigua CBS 183.55]KAF1929529.1 hypothetical protein M421DRAFT_419319 [Didymella exigua CBS 183.55]